MTPHRFKPLSSSRLSRLFDLDLPSSWNSEDGQVALRHQLDAPLLPDLATCSDINPNEIQSLLNTCKHPSTFGDQLTTKTPVLKLLSAIKLFAKHVHHDRNNPLSGNAGKVLYFAAIAAALSRCSQRISHLSDRELREGFAWALRQCGNNPLDPVFQAALHIL